jgi:cyclopropane fatty-acyl-phospholipid synthase-like methyltransferase
MFELIDSRILGRLGPAKTILDVGCGDGRLVTFLAYRTRRKVVGLDISSEGFTKAYETATHRDIGELIE